MPGSAGDGASAIPGTLAALQQMIRDARSGGARVMVGTLLALMFRFLKPAGLVR